MIRVLLTTIKNYNMKISIYLERFKSVVLQLAVLCVLSLYSCGDSSPLEEKATIDVPTSHLSWDVPHNTKTMSVDIAFTQEWSLEINSETSSWLSVSPKGGNAGKYTLQITVSANNGETKRTGIIAVCSGTARKEITVVQDGLAASLEIPSSQLSWNISHESKTISVDVTSAREWNVEMDSETSSWLSVSPKGGNAGNYTLQIAVSANEGEAKRTGIIAVCSSTVRKEIIIIQKEYIFKPEDGGLEDMPIEEWN